VSTSLLRQREDVGAERGASIRGPLDRAAPARGFCWIPGAAFRGLDRLPTPFWADGEPRLPPEPQKGESEAKAPSKTEQARRG
jgi:hypothetical protein